MHFAYLSRRGFEWCSSAEDDAAADPRDRAVVIRAISTRGIIIDVQLSTVGTGLFVYVRKVPDQLATHCTQTHFDASISVEDLTLDIVLPADLRVGSHATLQDAYNSSPFAYQRRIAPRLGAAIAYLARRLEGALNAFPPPAQAQWLSRLAGTA